MSQVFTIGHSTRGLEEFVEALTAHGVRLLVDVRTAPGSRRCPWFNGESLKAELPARGIAYKPIKALGGFRRPNPALAVNGGWRNASFRGFADYMQTAEFDAALREFLDAAAAGGPAALMCAEAVPWRCHRSLIADALAARGVPVRDIFTAASAKPHDLHKMARVREGRVVYPAEG